MENILEIAGVLGAVFSGINFILIGLAKVFWKLTFVKQEEDLLQLRKDYEKEKEKCQAFRHKHMHDIEGLSTILDMHIASIQKTMARLERAIDKLADSIVKNK